MRDSFWRILVYLWHLVLSNYGLLNCCWCLRVGWCVGALLINHWFWPSANLFPSPRTYLLDFGKSCLRPTPLDVCVVMMSHSGIFNFLMPIGVGSGSTTGVGRSGYSTTSRLMTIGSRGAVPSQTNPASTRGTSASTPTRDGR